MKLLKIAVCVHIYYEEVWADIEKKIFNINERFDLFVTCREEIYDKTKALVERTFPSAYVIPFQNIGMDALPFLMLSYVKELHQYDAILKLHTKNRKSSTRTEQGRIMYDSLIGNPKICQDVIDIFRRDPNVGMVGPAFMLRSADKLMYGNRKVVKQLLKSAEINVDDWRFFAGTMFWISGRALKQIADLYPAIARQADDDGPLRTGADGTLAHALERLFGATTAAAGLHLYVIERKSAFSDEMLLLPVEQHGPCCDPRFLQADTASMMRRSLEAKEACRVIAQSKLYVDDHYKAAMGGVCVEGMENIFHFVIYGDIFFNDPSDDFSVTFYLMRNNDVLRSGLPSLYHYIQYGMKEGRIGKPTRGNWLELAEFLGLFDRKFYSENYDDAAMLGLSAQEHYASIGYMFSRQTGLNFDPKKIPALAGSCLLGNDCLLDYLKYHHVEESRCYDLLSRAFDNGDYDLVHMLEPHIQQKFGATRALLEGIATSSTMKHLWDDASKQWQTFWEQYEQSAFVRRCRHSVTHFDKPTSTANGKFEIISSQGTPTTKVTKEKICVYTTLYGDRDNLLPIPDKVEGVDYVCFTDREREASGWQLRIIDPGLGDFNLNAKIFKILPHVYLSEYDASIFMDANTLMLGRIDRMLDCCIRNGSFVMWQHPLREDIYMEASAIIGFYRHSPAKLLEQISTYADDGLPDNVGLAEASFMWRRHNDPKITALMQRWWKEILRFSKRDQLSLGYLMWKMQVKPRVFPDEFGTSRKNVFFLKLPHKKTTTQSEGNSTNRTVSAPLAGSKQRITFLYSQKFAASGSTVMRGAQLSSLIKGVLSDEFAITYSDNTEIRGEIIILTKGFLKTTSPEQLRELGKCNILVADFVDEPPIDQLVHEVDGLMAASLVALTNYLTHYPEKSIHNITHHVDTRIPWGFAVPGGNLKSGYFGEKVNTISSPAVEKFVTIVQVDTSTQSVAWMDELTKYNFHYAVRRKRKIDGAKPFLKGFTAAHAGANIIIQRGEGDASYYLGPDYPYLLKDACSEEDILEALRAIQDDFGSSNWQYGLEIMRDVKHRSSLDFIIKEFRNMIHTFTK